MVTYTLPSTDWCNTPGMVRWAQAGAKFKRDRAKMIKVFVDGYGLPKLLAAKLVDGDCVINDQDGTVTVTDAGNGL